MENNEKEKSIKSEILDKIESGRVKMKPRAVFILKIAGLSTIVILLAFFAVFLISFAFYVNKFPLMLILISLILILLIEALMHRIKFSYRKPVVYTLLLVLLSAVLLGFILHITPFHSKVSCFCHKNSLPIISNLYDRYELGNNASEGCGCGACKGYPRELK